LPKRGRAARPGLTLIEVLVALFILATGLLAALVAQQEYLRQFGDLQEQGEAAEVARVLMAELLAAPDGNFPQKRGDVPGRADWTWTQSARPHPTFADQKTYLLEAAVYRRSASGEETCLARLQTLRLMGGGAAAGKAGP